MKVKALKSFVGIVSMNINDIKDIPNKNIVDDLVKSKYIELLDNQKDVEIKNVSRETKSNVSQETKPKTKARAKNKK